MRAWGPAVSSVVCGDLPAYCAAGVEVEREFIRRNLSYSRMEYQLTFSGPARQITLFLTHSGPHHLHECMHDKALLLHASHWHSCIIGLFRPLQMMALNCKAVLRQHPGQWPQELRALCIDGHIAVMPAQTGSHRKNFLTHPPYSSTPHLVPPSASSTLLRQQSRRLRQQQRWLRRDPSRAASASLRQPCTSWTRSRRHRGTLQESRGKERCVRGHSSCFFVFHLAASGSQSG